MLKSRIDWNGGDSAGAKGWSNACGGAFKIPYHLADGDYTVQVSFACLHRLVGSKQCKQWVWFGQGNGNNANSPFQACIDLKISGGPTGAQPKCPLFKGGDMSEAGNNVCTFVSVDGGDKYQGVCKSANACQGKCERNAPECRKNGQMLNPSNRHCRHSTRSSTMLGWKRSIYRKLALMYSTISC